MRPAYAVVVSRRRPYMACRRLSSPLWALQPRCLSSVHCGPALQARWRPPSHMSSRSRTSNRCGRGSRRNRVNAQPIAQAETACVSDRSHQMDCNHIADRVRRRRQLEDAIRAAQAFRNWCAMHASCAQAKVGASVSAPAARRPGESLPSSTPVLPRVGSSGGSVATLADIGHEEHSSRRTMQHHRGLSPPTTHTTNPSRTASGAEVPLTERRLLEHYAALLQSIRTAAARVATSDYHRFYAAEVKALLAASASGGGCDAFSVPRTVVWQDAAASAYPGEGEEDATAQAERRLAAWALSWYNDLEQWHSRYSKHTPAWGNTVGTQQPVLHGDLWQDVVDGGESVVGTREEDKSMAALLLQGKWRAVIDSLVEADAAPPRSASSTAIEPNSSSSTPPQRPSIKELFSMTSVRRRRRAPWRPSPPPLPRRLALAPVTPAELRLLQHPPSPGLRVLSHSIATAAQRAECQEGAAGNGLAPASSLFLEEAAAAEVAAGRATGIPPTCVVRLRRRLWVLQHLPRHLPASLVRFQEPRRSVERMDGGSGREVLSGAMPRAYLLRSHALEKLPWYTLCVLGEVLEASGNDHSTVQTVLHKARTHMCDALFLSVHADYAALHDYAHALFLTLGSNMVARAVAARQQKRGRGSSGSDSDASVTVFESAFARTAIALLQPPPPEAYATAGLSPGSTSSSDTAASLPARSSSAQTRSASTAITNLHVVPPDVFHRLCVAVQDWRNYHLSLYCETLSQIADSDGVALRELTRVLAAPPHGEDALQEEAPVVLAPESAAAIVTALLLQLLDQLSRPSASPSSTTARAPLSLLHGAGRTTDAHVSAGCAPLGASASLSPLPQLLYFSVPHDKAHAVASYFKGIFHRSFFKRVVAAPPCTTGAHTADEGSGGASVLPSFVLPPTQWERNAAARLLGRTLRRLDRYPTRTTEAFFARYVRGDDVDAKRKSDGEGGTEAVAAAAQPASTTVAPPLAMGLFVVDLQAVVDYWHGCRHRPILDAPRTASSYPQQQEQVPLRSQPFVDAVGDGRTANTQPDATVAATSAGVENSLPKIGKDDLPGPIVLLASPSMLPHGLHAVYKPAGVNCTLHTHYPSLVYPFLTRELPWRTGGGVVVADGCGRNRDAEASSSLASCVPVLRQQGLVNRVDVGTSGIVLVARASAALHGAVDAMIREHHMRKTYRALVQRWPPLSCSSSASTVPCGGAGAAVGPLFSVSPFLSPMVNAVVCAPVYAAGATAASICRRSALPLGHGRQLQSFEPPRADALAVSRAGSTPPWSTNVPISPSSLTHVHQQYATLHASLQDQRNAITRYRVLEYFASAGVAYVHVELHSGRRHQIRQHFAQLGFPLVGDARYHPGVVAGHVGTTFGMQRAALHAYTIDILATTDGDGLANGEEVPDRVVVQAVLPADMHRALLELRQAERAKSRQQRRPPQQPRG